MFFCPSSDIFGIMPCFMQIFWDSTKIDVCYCKFTLRRLGGGGGRVKNKNSPILLYVVGLLMAFLKWAHFPLNSQRLPRYESLKIALQMLHWPPNLVSSFLPLKSSIIWNRFLIFRFLGISKTHENDLSSVTHTGNRWELRGKWAHFRKAMSRATTYNKMGEFLFLTLGPPQSP